MDRVTERFVMLAARELIRHANTPDFDTTVSSPDREYGCLEAVEDTEKRRGEQRRAHHYLSVVG